MIRPAFNLTHTPFYELIEDIQLLLDYDAKELKRQTEYFRELEREGKKPPNYLKKFKQRLEHLQTRIEFITALLCRLQTYDFRYMVKAIEAAREKAELEGRKGQYAFALMYHPEEETRIILY